MKKNNWASCLLLLVIGCLLVAAGCGKPGFLRKMEDKSLGVVLQTTKGSQEGLNLELVDYLSRRTKLQVVGSPLLGEINNSPETYTRLKNDLGLDYLLEVVLSDIRFEEEKSLSASEGISASITNQCSLIMAYRVIDLAAQKVVFLGQSRGTAKEQSSSINANSSGISINFGQADQEELIQEAVVNALWRTKLL